MIEYILFIKIIQNNVYLTTNICSYILEKNFDEYINDLLSKNLRTLKAEKEVLYKLFNFRKNPPIYIDKMNILVYIKSNDIYLNYFGLTDIQKINNKTELTYINTKIIINDSYNTFKKKIERAKVISDYISKCEKNKLINS